MSSVFFAIECLSSNLENVLPLFWIDLFEIGALTVFVCWLMVQFNLAIPHRYLLLYPPFVTELRPFKGNKMHACK
jgi:hypothetical protein